MNLTDVVGTVIDGKYRVEHMLGRGGMGAVYFATHVGTERPVALKIIIPQYAADASFLERFRREARAAGRFRHPNIVDVTDFGEALVGDQRVAYLVMEYLDGCSLEDVLAEQPVVPVEWTVEVFEQLALGIGELHRQGIIHRDLKPGNIWLEPNLRGGFTVKLLDFGLAKLNEPDSVTHGHLVPTPALNASDDATVIVGSGSSESKASVPTASEAPTVVSAPNAPVTGRTVVDPHATESIAHPSEETRVDGSARPTAEPAGSTATEPAGELTVAGSVLGTPAYMSPEQCRGEMVTDASDIYSLGVIAYQMLAGGLPFSGSIVELMTQHVQAEPEDLRSRNADVSAAVSGVVMSALAKDPDDRPATVELFAASLKAKAESPWNLVSRGIVLLFENLPVFLRTTAVLLFPYFMLVAVETIVFIVFVEASGEAKEAKMALGALAPVNWLLILLGTIFARGVITLLIGQILLVPLKKLRVELVFSLLRRKLLPALQAATILGVTSVFPASVGFGLIKSAVIPTLVPETTTIGAVAAMVGPTVSIATGTLLMLAAFALACELTQLANVVLIERLPIREAIRRSRELRRRATADTIFVTVLVLIPLLIPTVVDLMQAQFVQGPFAGALAAVFMCAGRLVLVTFNAVLISTLYFKQRQTAGESIEAVLACQYVSEPPPMTMWQQRLNVSLESLRSGDRRSHHSGMRSGAGTGARSGERSGSIPPKSKG